MRIVWWVALVVGLWTAQPSAAQAERLQPGATIRGTLTADQLTATFIFAGEYDAIYTISAEPQGNSPYLIVTLFDPDDSQCLRDDPNFSQSVQLGPFQVRKPGDYRVTVEAETPQDFSIQLIQRDTPRLSIAETLEDYFPGDVGTLTYHFEAAAGDVLVAQASSELLDLALSIYSPDGTLIGTDDDNGGQLNARLNLPTLTAAGLYRLVVNRYRPLSSGRIYVRIAPVATEHSPNFMDYGERRTMSLDADSPQVTWMFQGVDGDIVGLVIDDPGGIARVQVLDSERPIADSVEERPGLVESVSHFTLPRSGFYRIIVEALVQGATGDIQIRLERLGERSLDAHDPQVRGLDAVSVFLNIKAPVTTFVFDGHDDAVGTLHVQQRVPDADAYPASPFRIVMRQGGEVFASYTLPEVIGLTEIDLSIRFFMPQTAPVEVELTLLRDGPVWFTVSRELVWGMG